MQPSRFNITIPDEPLPGGMLIFNTLSGALYELEPEYRRALEHLIAGQVPTAEEASLLHELAAEDFVVEDPAAERERAIHRLRTASYSTGAITHAIVVTTMACNLACRYCLESGMTAGAPMSAETATLVAERLVRRVKDTGSEGILVDFYGGEPLLNQGCIHFLAVRLQKWAEDARKQWRFTMTTNGTLLTPKVIAELRPLGLSSVRVSIDGVREVHDARRPFRTGGGSSHDAVLANLRAVAPLIPVTLVMTLSPGGVARLPEFLDELDAAGILPHLAAISPGIEQAYLNAEGAPCGGGQSCIKSAAAAGDYCAALRLLADRGVPTGAELLQADNCSVMMNGGMLVYTPDGRIYKCPSLMGRDEWAVGHVARERLDDRYYELVNRELWRPCLDSGDCPFVPMCGCAAGCRYAAHLAHGDWMGCACARGFFEKAVPELMRLQYTKTMNAHVRQEGLQ